MGFQEERGILCSLSQRQELLRKLTCQVQMALRAMHMVEPAEDRKALGDSVSAHRRAYGPVYTHVPPRGLLAPG